VHKRCDEIASKAAIFKSVYPAGKFAALIYYPFEEEGSNVRSRLSSEYIDALSFAPESDYSIKSTLRQLLAELEARKEEPYEET